MLFKTSPLVVAVVIVSFIVGTVRVIAKHYFAVHCIICSVRMVIVHCVMLFLSALNINAWQLILDGHIG